MVDAFSLNPQRDRRKNALAVAHAKGKLEKRLYFSPHCGDETTTCYNRALRKITEKANVSRQSEGRGSPASAGGRAPGRIRALTARKRRLTP